MGKTNCPPAYCQTVRGEVLLLCDLDRQALHDLDLLVFHDLDLRAFLDPDWQACHDLDRLAYHAPDFGKGDLGGASALGACCLGRKLHDLGLVRPDPVLCNLGLDMVCHCGTCVVTLRLCREWRWALMAGWSWGRGQPGDVGRVREPDRQTAAVVLAASVVAVAAVETVVSAVPPAS